MMMPPPQVVGVLLKKPGQQTHPRLPPLDQQETKIRGESHRRRAISFGSLSSLCPRVCNATGHWRSTRETLVRLHVEFSPSNDRVRTSVFVTPSPSPPSSCSRKVITHSSDRIDRMLLLELPRKMNPLL